MSVLRKKIEREPGLPDEVKNGLAVWQPLHVAVYEMFSALTHLVWEPRRVELDFGDLKSMQSGVSDIGLKFGFGDAKEEISILAHFDRQFAAHVTTRSLDLSEDGEIESHVPELLDLLLFKPIAETLDEEIIKLFNVLRRSATGGMRQIDKGLRLNDFEFARGQGLWNKLTFHGRLVNPNASDALEAEDMIETEEGGMSSVAESDILANTELSFNILLPQSLLQKLLVKLSAKTAQAAQSAGGPWSTHMYHSLEGAKVQLKAVIESFDMSVADCTRLEIGEVIDLPGVSLQSIGLETDMNDGPVSLATAALGIYKSHRAIKLTSDLDREFFTTPIGNARSL